MAEKAHARRCQIPARSSRHPHPFQTFHPVGNQDQWIPHQQRPPAAGRHNQGALQIWTSGHNSCPPKQPRPKFPRPPPFAVSSDGWPRQGTPGHSKILSGGKEIRHRGRQAQLPRTICGLCSLPGAASWVQCIWSGRYAAPFDHCPRTRGKKRRLHLGLIIALAARPGHAPTPFQAPTESSACKFAQNAEWVWTGAN